MVRFSAACAAALSLLFTVQATGLPGAASAAEPRSDVSITKTNNLGGKPLQPGDDFIYTLTGQCSGLTVDCVHFTVTDTLPAEFDVTSLPKSNSNRDVTYDSSTRLLTVVYKEPLQNPSGETGLRAGQSGSIEIGMRLPADTQEKDGTVVPNTASVKADNADEKSSSTDVKIFIPKVVKPVATKSWADGSAVAGSGEESTLTLGVRNNSSSSADVTQLSLSDDNPAVFEDFDFESAKVTAFPAGADQAHLVVTTADGTTHTGATVSAPAPAALPLPRSVAPGDVVGFEVVFTNSKGDPLPYDSSGGTVEVKLKLRDTKRSDGSPLRPTDKLTVNNCATPSAVEKIEGTVAGEPACASYDILPDILNLNATKAFFPDSNGDFSHQSSEHAVVGENSPVSGLIDVTNESPFPVKTMTITEPAPGEASNFDEIDVQKVRLRFPEGATSAKLTVSYADGTSTTSTYTSDQTVDVAKAGTTVTKITVTYTGEDADGNPTIKEGADAGLDIHGTLVDGVSAGPLTNCARFAGDAGRTDGSGTATGHVCQDLQVEDPHTSGEGSKTVDQTDVPIGQPIPMHLTITNNGNTPMVHPVITDPSAQSDGSPDPNNKTFDYLQIDSISISPADTPATIEIWDPDANSGKGAWVAYDASNTDQLHRAKGIRVTYNGDLPPEGTFTINVVTERREGTPDGVSFQNCFSLTAQGYTGPGETCSASMNTGPAEDSASLNKSISPGELPEYVPGLPRQHADATLSIRNTGNMSAKLLRMTDRDADFFDAVDLVSIKSNQMPAGADRVQIDAYVGGKWVNGTPSASAALPAGVNAADVTGIRATYTSTSTFNDGYTITPCAADSCTGKLVLDVSPRPALRSSGGPVPSHLEDTLGGSYLTKLETDGVPAGIKPVKATLDLIKGTPRLAVSKTPNTVLSPGEDAPFYLKVENTGTANIPNLVVKDDLPAGIAFNSSFQGDNGQPYKIINESVPSGTPAVPTPVFTPTNSGSRVSGLTWDFSKDDAGKAWVLAPGATFTIEIHVTLEPGIHANDVVTNTMGATSSDPDMVCEDTAHQQVDGTMFGAGTYCTSSATLTAKSGAAFQARKWVSGNDSLGWYNTSSKKTVPVGDSSCLSITGPDGRMYTANPCIALVNPGDRYHYLMRLQNAGTEPGTAMRIVDRFPVQGDKGVILDQARGTAWDKRPTLASRPQLTGPGAMSVAYENSEPLCTDDLNMGGAGSSSPQCPSSTWNDPYSTRAVGMRIELTYDPDKMAPGAIDQITWAMDTPLDVTHNGDPTIAWNSYAHNETTDRAAGAAATPVTPPRVPSQTRGLRAATDPRVLQPNEPIQVGVALAYGELRLVKHIGKHPSALDPAIDKVPFTYHVTCTIHPQGHLPRTVIDQDYKVSADKPVTLDGIPAGATCQVWETTAYGGSTNHPSSDPVEITIKPGIGTKSVQTAAITNTFEYGHLQLKKKVDGSAASYTAGRTFKATVTCALPDSNGNPSSVVLHRTYQVTADKPVTIGPLPVNSRCWASEVDTGGAAKAVVDHNSPDNPVVVTEDSTGTATITITNTFPGAQLVITKHVVNGSAGPYTFTLACTTGEGEVPLPAADRTFELKDGEHRTITVPDGAHCTVKETNIPAGDTVTFAASTGGKDGGVTVDGSASVEVTNTFPPAVGPHHGHHGGGLARTGVQDWTTLAGIVAALTAIGGAAVFRMARRRRT
ncbi:hypothetical protein BIV57_12735 [Mangrovactinospora gilvigrisea]|uniref:DUF11 domain-containing protein n=2 Tax=Mangrovactinospora gilvigrisea TaxID=1428644 RepID=A0A1J7C6D3_9ACTN|nr:hypothetical protein BIV57_12735 [Mangrovactinospora gilvigrisea]